MLVVFYEVLLSTASSLSLIFSLNPQIDSSYPLLVNCPVCKNPLFSHKEVRDFVVKEDHVLKLELKQVVKKLKEDPRIVIV